MCWEEKCFSFENYRNKKVTVFISGPGYLEYPWALETILRLHNSGANVKVVDLSNVATAYAMRLKIGSFILPIFARRILRIILLNKSSRIEKKVKEICLGLRIPYKTESLNFTKFNFRKKIKLKFFQNVYWSKLSAIEILKSVFSSYERRELTNDDKIDKQRAMNIYAAIIKTQKTIHKLDLDSIDIAFLANGRQPVQATVTLLLRESNVPVVLYESGGGYIFPNLLPKRIDYFFTSPANTLEIQGKILCKEFNPILKNTDHYYFLIELIKSRVQIPFSLDYLTNKIKFEDDFPTSGKNYAFFTTTAWETSVIENNLGHEKSSLFTDQLNAITHVIKNLNKDDKLFLRIHPNDPGINSISESYWNNFEHLENVQIIDSDSKIDSYDLAKKMDANFVWLSFLGFELALQNITVAVLGNAVYAPLFNRNWIKSESELQSWMKRPGKCSEQDLLKYISYLSNGGFRINSSRTDEFRNVIIQGQNVDMVRGIFKIIPIKLLKSIS
jgi:hypothetical protein